MFIVFACYYTLGLVLSVILTAACSKYLGQQGLYELYTEEYGETTMTPTQVEVLVYSMILLALPFAYGAVAIYHLFCKYKDGFKRVVKKVVARIRE